MQIDVTPAERSGESLTLDHLQQAVQAVLDEGYVILANVVDHEVLDIIHERMEADSQELTAAKKWGGAGHMIATVHPTGWMKRDRRMLYSLNSADQFPLGPLDHNADFTEKPLDYL